MSPLWLVPGAVALLGSAVVVGLLRNAAEEARLLAAEIGRQREVTEALAGLGSALRRLRLPNQRRR